MTALRRVVLAAGLGVLALSISGCGPDESVSVGMATTEARSLARDDATALQEALSAGGDAAAVRDAVESWARTALGEQAGIQERSDGAELVMVYDVLENQGGGWFSSEVVVRLCTRLLVQGAGDVRVVLEGAECPADLSAPGYGDSFTEVGLE
ncbi:hypothetical protein [Cellulomonas sp. NS3]|uniref:hypothetical protein n=1 Tax=Cellulomonas sp. NS3 TaxID=2973977 RepID=UPI0021615E8C|nr:hypothetical protein [Cellulomonas sp. NS3]